MAFHVPAVWGTNTWTVIHTAALVYSEPTPQPNERRESALSEWFHALPWVLPCGSCGAHCLAYIESHPPPIKGTSGTRALFDWTVDFHNSVNERTGKRVITHEEALTSLLSRVNDLPTAVGLHTESLARQEDLRAFKAARGRSRVLLVVAMSVAGALILALILLVWSKK